MSPFPSKARTRACMADRQRPGQQDINKLKDKKNRIQALALVTLFCIVQSSKAREAKRSERMGRLTLGKALGKALCATLLRAFDGLGEYARYSRDHSLGQGLASAGEAAGEVVHRTSLAAAGGLKLVVQGQSGGGARYGRDGSRGDVRDLGEISVLGKFGERKRPATPKRRCGVSAPGGGGGA